MPINQRIGIWRPGGGLVAGASWLNVEEKDSHVDNIWHYFFQVIVLDYKDKKYSFATTIASSILSTFIPTP